MATFSVYSDVPDFLANGAANVETASLVGGSAPLSTSVAAGATTLPLTGVIGFPPSGTFTAYLLDGANSERVLASVSGGSLVVGAGTAAAHAAGITVCSAGSAGCLADAIIRASRAIEGYCKQGPDGGVDRSLFASLRTEIAHGPSTRAHFDTNYALVISPWRWPVLSLSTVMVQFGADGPINLATTPIFIPTEGRWIIVPYASVAPSPVLYSIQGRRGDGFVATWSYVGGPCVGSALAGVPDDMRMACHLLVADILSQRQNPYGVSEASQGKVHRIHRHRSDTWTSLFREHAYELLAPYAH